MTTRPPDATQPRRSTVRQQLRWAEDRARRLERDLAEAKRLQAQAEREAARYGGIVAAMMEVLDAERGHGP